MRMAILCVVNNFQYLRVFADPNLGPKFKAYIALQLHCVPLNIGELNSVYFINSSKMISNPVNYIFSFFGIFYDGISLINLEWAM